MAILCQYNTQDSFSKAFARFHGVPPSKVQRGTMKLFHPMSIHVSAQGGFEMSQNLIDAFYWNDIDGQADGNLSDAEKYI